MDNQPESSPRILIVDDDVGQADMLLEYLHISGFQQVDLVENIRDLWRKLKEKENGYEIILLDYMLTDGTGLDVLRQMPERECRIPVIMVTGQGSERIAAQAIQSGAADYLIKTGDYLMTIPALIKKTLDAAELKRSIESSLQAMRESEARYRAIVEDYQTELICRFQPSGAITFANEVFCRYFERRRDELIGMNFLYFVPEDERPKIIQHLAAFSASRPVAALEHRVSLGGQGGQTPPEQGTNRGIRWIQRTDRAILDEDGCIFEFQSMARDITERKKLESQLQAAQAHLVQAARLATIGEMASGVAHQIYNPLTTIIADAQILLRHIAEQGPARESAQAIEQAGWRLQEVVQRLMEFSRPASEAFEAVSINETIQSALSLASAHIEEIGCRIETKLADDLPAVSGNPRQIENLWVYLLLLARDACRDGKGDTIRITSNAGPGGGKEHPGGNAYRFVLVEVSDNGNPIPEDQLATIFEPNFVGPTSGRGTGMELSICREIVRQHNGQITADSAFTDHAGRSEGERAKGGQPDDTASRDKIAIKEGQKHPNTVFRVALPVATGRVAVEQGGNLPGANYRQR